jgi:hypothetical protein
MRSRSARSSVVLNDVTSLSLLFSGRRRASKTQVRIASAIAQHMTSCVPSHVAMYAWFGAWHWRRWRVGCLAWVTVLWGMRLTPT